MYRKGIPEVLRQKILKDTLWRLKLSAQLLLNDSLDGQWNATYGDSAGAELCSPETLLRLPHRVSGCLTLGGWGQTSVRAPAWCPSLAPRHSLTLTGEVWAPESYARNYMKVQLKEMYISRCTLFSVFVNILCVSTDQAYSQITKMHETLRILTWSWWG